MGNTNDWLNFEHFAEEKLREVLKPPSIYKVILNNDDYTPMEFVVDVLQKFFSYDIERATQLMLGVHYYITRVRRFAASLPLTWQKLRLRR